MVTQMSLNEKFRTEFAKAFARNEHEITDDGKLYLPKQRCFIGGVIGFRIDAGPLNIANNTATFEGLNDLIAVYFTGSAQRPAFYFAPYSNNVAPDQTLTAANFASTMGEYTNYTEGTRPLWTPGAVAAQSVDNSAAPARMTIGTGGGTVRGAGLITNQTKSATTGILFAAAAFDTAATLTAGSKLDLEYILTAQDA